MSETLRLYVGYDSREDIAWQVCRHSVLQHASKPVEVSAAEAAGAAGAGHLHPPGRHAGLDRVHLQPLPGAGAGRVPGLGGVLRLRLPVVRRHRRPVRPGPGPLRGDGRAARLSAEGGGEDGRQAAGRLSAQELVQPDAVQLRPPGQRDADAGGGEPRDRRLPAPLPVAGGRPDRLARHRLELARRLVPEAGQGHAAGGALHPRRPVVRELPGRRLRPGMARRRRRGPAAGDPRLRVG